MKPSRTQYFFALNWPLRTAWLLIAILSVFVTARVCEPNKVLFHDWPYTLLFAVCILLAPIFAYFLSLPFAWLVVDPLYQFRARLNGAPFRPGDRLRILVGPHRGRIVRVYDVSDTRNLVRVDLDERAKERVKDVYSFTQVCRVGDS